MNQQTIQQAVRFQGIGVHNGLPVAVTVMPAQAQTGLRFQHADHVGDDIVVGRVVPEMAPHATVLRGKGWAVSTVEHLLAALAALGIDNAYLVVEGYEIPILDGSAYPFIPRLQAAGLVVYDQKKIIITPVHPLVFEHGGRRLAITPRQPSAQWQVSVDYAADFAAPYMGAARVQYTVSAPEFIAQILPARTFGFLEQLPMLRAHGLAQGSTLGNTVVVGPQGLMNAMRVPDECIRHKVLDLVGDLALLGGYLDADLVASNTGHAFNRLVIEHMVTKPELWIIEQ